MGLRCLIGHEYGEPRTSQDRRQRGSEVVVTVREYRECTRCGHRRIISENKEVTADPAADTSDDQSAQAAWTPADDAAEPSSFPVSEADLPGTTDEPLTAAEDDGVILDDEPDGPPRSHGEWPESDHGGEPVAPSDDDHKTWSDEFTEPAEHPVDDPASIGGDEPIPEPAPDAPGDTTPDGPDEPRAEVTRGASASPPRPDNRNIEFVCPECSETWPSQNASLRPGDICPSCRRGYLDEQVVQ